MTLNFRVLILISVLATQAAAQNRQNDIDRFFSTLSQNQQFNGNVLIAEDGKIVFEKSLR
jgi:hypothetical protein